MTNREISKNRADELKAYSVSYLEAKKTLKYGLDEKIAARIQASKALIIKHLNVGDKEYEDWRWQFKNRFTSFDKLDFYFSFSEHEKRRLEEITQKYRMAITPYYLSLIDPADPEDPIRRMALASYDELDETGFLDPMLEAQTNPCGLITRRYPDRLIINVTNACAMYCRHCQRRRKIGEIDKASAPKDIEDSINYIRENPEIRDVLITGGDPLTLPDYYLEKLIGSIRSIPHVEIIRIGSRMPVTLPQRITPELVSILKKYHPFYINTQFNHPVEITEEAARACDLLADNGIMSGNQMVLLDGVNNDPYVVRLLNQQLLRIRVRPYYIFHPKKVKGTQHFYVNIEDGLSIIDSLRGHTSGMAIPTYIINAPGGQGKVPLLPSYITSHKDNKYYIKNWEGKIIEYEE